jgi:hypothetical protein
VSPDPAPRRDSDAKSSEVSLSCRHLRTKTMYYDFNREAALEVGPECATARYWCARTSRALGPDDDVVGREACVASRGCFET